MRDRGYQISWNCNRSIDLTEIIGETMSASGQTRSFGFVGSMSGLPENGHDLQPADGRVERERHAAGRRWVLPPVALARALHLDAVS